MGKKDLTFGLFEPLLLFTVYFLPGYLSQNQMIDSSIFDSYLFNIGYSITSAGEIFLLYYILTLRLDSEILAADYGLRPVQIKDIFYSLFITAGIFLLMLPLAYLPDLFSHQESKLLTNPVNWKISNPSLIPLIFLTCIITGYREELFFRSYMMNYLKLKNAGMFSSVILTSLLFSGGHLYQGYIGFAGTFLIGSFLAVLFLKGRNLHVIAVAHGLYNFITLIQNFS